MWVIRSGENLKCQTVRRFIFMMRSYTSGNLDYDLIHFRDTGSLTVCHQTPNISHQSWWLSIVGDWIVSSSGYINTFVHFTGHLRCMSILACMSCVSTPCVVLCNHCVLQRKLEYAYMFTSTGDQISVYVKTADGLRQVWSSARRNSGWTHQYVDLGRIDADQFTVIFHVRFGSWCRTSVGLDNVKFHPCTVGECVASMCLILAS